MNRRSLGRCSSWGGEQAQRAFQSGLSDLPSPDFKARCLAPCWREGHPASPKLVLWRFCSYANPHELPQSSCKGASAQQSAQLCRTLAPARAQPSRPAAGSSPGWRPAWGPPPAFAPALAQPRPPSAPLPAPVPGRGGRRLHARPSPFPRWGTAARGPGAPSCHGPEAAARAWRGAARPPRPLGVALAAGTAAAAAAAPPPGQPSPAAEAPRETVGLCPAPRPTGERAPRGGGSAGERGAAGARGPPGADPRPPAGFACGCGEAGERVVAGGGGGPGPAAGGADSRSRRWRGCGAAAAGYGPCKIGAQCPSN